MAQYDPTLPESTLIARVKTAQDSDALLNIVDRHSGIYFSVVNRYAAAYPNTIKARDLDDDKLFNFYQFVVAYDPERGSKLSTYIGDRTDYLCRSMLKESKRDPLAAFSYAASGCMPLSEGEDVYISSDGAAVTLEDESTSSHVAENAESDLDMQDVRRAAKDRCHDERFIKILDCRHFNPGHETMSWREVGKRVGLSHEGCRRVYHHNLHLIKDYLAS